MKQLYFSIIILFFFIASIDAQSLIAKGIVYLDKNQNGKRDRKETVLQGVAVSNGEEVVLTNEKGQYQIFINPEDAIIFVIKPADYNFPVNDFNLPQFYYIHRPNGSPELRYKGSDPTGSLPKTIDFPLVEGNDSDEFGIIVISDPQVYFPKEIEYYEKDFVPEMQANRDQLFGITLGDIVGDSLNYYSSINNVTAKFGIPWYHVPGNHDINYDAATPAQADESFESHYGPSTYAFNQGKVHFIVLNDVIFPNDLNGRFYVGGLRESQFSFIENSLRYIPENHLIVLLMHIQLFDENPNYETFLASHRERLFRLLKDRPYTFSLSGHTHYQRHVYFGDEDGWLQEYPHHHYNVGTASGDWWSGKPEKNGVPASTMRDGTPNGYNIIRFKGNQYSFEYRSAGKPRDYKLRLYGPKVVSQNQYNGGEFSVNFFQGSERDTVIYRIDNGEWQKMHYSVEPDPYINALRYEWDHAESLPSEKRPSHAVPSWHLWKTRIPTHLPEGKHSFSVEVRDHQGGIYRGQTDFRVEQWRGE